MLSGVASAQGRAGSATVSDTVRARALADAGANAYARGDYETARGYFERAFGIVRAPTVALFEARSLVRLRRLVDARAAYLRALDTRLGPDSPAPFAPAVAAAGTELAELVPRIPRLKVVVRGAARNDSAVDVRLDQRRLARAELGAWLLVDPGVHEISARGEGEAAAPLRVALAEGDARAYAVEASEPVARDPKRTWGLVGLGIGGAGLALGIGAGLVAMNAHDEVERSCDGGVCRAGSSGADALDRFRDWRTVSVVGYAVGAAGAGTGIALLLSSGRSSGASTGLVLRPAHGGVSMEGTW